MTHVDAFKTFRMLLPCEPLRRWIPYHPDLTEELVCCLMVAHVDLSGGIYLAHNPGDLIQEYIHSAMYVVGEGNAYSPDDLLERYREIVEYMSVQDVAWMNTPLANVLGDGDDGGEARREW